MNLIRFRHQFMFSKEQNASIILNISHLTMGSMFESLWFYKVESDPSSFFNVLFLGGLIIGHSLKGSTRTMDQLVLALP